MSKEEGIEDIKGTETDHLDIVEVGIAEGMVLEMQSSQMMMGHMGMALVIYLVQYMTHYSYFYYYHYHNSV